MTDISQDNKSQENVLGVVCYLLGWVTGIIVWFSVPKTRKFIRFHAMQSIIFSIIFMVISIVLSFVPIIGWIVSSIAGLLASVLWLLLMVKAYQRQIYKLPVIGDLADKWSN